MYVDKNSKDIKKNFENIYKIYLKAEDVANQVVYL